jgi:tetratricopeptide (TPR) repeat protein
MSNMLAGKALAAAWPYVDTPEGKNSDETLNKLREAGQHFLTAWKYNPIFPEAAAELIKSAREHLTDASPRYWFDQSVSAQFDYLPAYKNFLSCLLPEHGGSRDAMIAFGKECALTDRYDTEVPLQLIEALRQIDKEELDDNFWRQPDLYQAACGVLEKAASVDGAPKERRSALIATRIVIALRADRFDGIAPLLSQTTDEDLRVAMSKHRYSMALGMLRSKAALAAAGVDLAGIQTELHQANASGTAAAAIARIDDELAKVPADVDRAWLHYWRSALPHMEDFHAGKWVNVSQCEEFPRLMDATHWEVKDHTTFVCHSTEFLPFNWLAYFRTPLECTFDVQVNEVPAETILSGLVVGQRAGPGWPSGRIFGINAVKNKVGYDRITANDPKYFPVKLLDVNHFHVRAWPEYFELFVNDERVAAQHDPSFTPYQSLGFWTEVTKDGDVDAIYSNFRIRRISIEPPPADDSAGERMAYFTTQVKNEPDNPYHLIDRGDLHLAARHLDHAIEDFKQAATIRQNWALPEAKIGMAEAAAGKYREALAAYQRALAIDGDCTIALDRLAWLEATCPDASFRSGAKAGQHAKLANDLTSGTSGAYQLTVSAAYAEQGKFKEANTEFQRATRSTKTENFSALEKALQDSYKQRKPYRYTSAVAVDAKGK